MRRSFISMPGVALHTLTGPRYSRQRRKAGRVLRGIGDALFWVAGAPIALATGMMWLGGRLRGWAFEVERDR